MGEIIYVRAMVENKLPSGQIGVKLVASNTDGIRIKENTYYKLVGGEFVEVQEGAWKE